MRATLSLLFLACGFVLSAQVINPPPGNDEAVDTTSWRGWTGLSLSWRPVSRIELSWNEQWRWNEDLTSFDRQIHQFGVEWDPKWNKLAKAQNLGFGVRLTSKPDRKGAVQGVSRFLRWQLDYGAGITPGRWSLKGRVRFQKQTAVSLKGGEDPSSIRSSKQFRFKGLLRYNIKGWKLDPEFSAERFVAQLPEGWQRDNRWRFRLGTALKTGKRQKLRVFVQRDGQGRYFPTAPGTALAEVGAGLDDIRQSGKVDWTVGILWHYRLKSPSRPKD